MTHDEYRELLGLHALGAIDPAERRALESHVEACPSCTAELAELRDTTADLTFLAAPITPRAGDFERLLATLDADLAGDAIPESKRADARRPPAREPRTATVAATRARYRRPRVFAVGVAAVAVIAILMVSHWRLLGRLEDAYSEMDRMRAIGRFVSSPDVSVVPLWGGEAAHAKLAYDRMTGRFVLLSSGLPALPRGKRYQLWVFSERIQRAGAFLPDAPDGLLLALPRATLFLFAVSVEPFRDVDEPTGDLVLLSDPVRNPL